MEYNNKIITISGEPVSGKGTVTKALIERLKKEGYKEDKIHLDGTGAIFRTYFAKIIKLMQSFENEKEIQELKEDEDIKLIMSLEEHREKVIEALAKVKASNINMTGLTIADYNELEELSPIRKIVDKLIDEGIKIKYDKIAKTQIPEDIWIVDSRLAFHNIPNSFAIRLTCNSNVAGERLFNDQSRNEEDKYDTLEDAIAERENRRKVENARYIEKYGIDLENPDNYDMVVDTSYSTPGDIVEAILKCLDYYQKGLIYARDWSSPKSFLPLQNIRHTYEKARFSFEEIEESIRKNGYDPANPIIVLEADGIMGIYEGHHRNFAMAHQNKTLIPYEILAKDDEDVIGRYITARAMMYSMRLSDIYDHEEIFRESEAGFSYEKIYPGIYDKVRLIQATTDIVDSGDR